MDEPVGTDQVDKEAAAHVEEVLRCLAEAMMAVTVKQEAICQTIGSRRIETVRLINQMADKIIEISTAQNETSKVLAALDVRLRNLTAFVHLHLNQGVAPNESQKWN
jgi:lipid A disaccharide synthetase